MVGKMHLDRSVRFPVPLPHEEIVVVGANKLGIRTIFARYGDSFGTVDSGADWDINDVYEIVGIVNELNSV